MYKHIYIHWPFCDKKCWYCDFISFEQHQPFVHQYHTALCSEITHADTPFSPISTLFIGGGTPSRYPLPLIKELFATLRNKFDLQGLEEATIESNPGDVTQEHLETWKSLGINRLSIGVQILDEVILQNVNRIQKNDDVYRLLDIAPRYFDSLSVDLILGLPGTTDEAWFKTLEYVTSQGISHISVYFLTIYEKTPLYFKLQEKKLTIPSEDWMVDTYTKTIQILEAKSFCQYEISNFSRPGYESIHNRAYWNRIPYKGFGLSAASFDGKKRLVNSKNLVEYLDCCEHKKSPVAFEEVLSPQESLLEELMLGLRQKTGLDLQRMVYFLEVLSPNRDVSPGEKIAQLKENGLVEIKNNRIFLTVSGMFLENEIIVNLL